MVGGVKTSCHTRLPSLNYAGSNVQPSVFTHSLTGPFFINGLQNVYLLRRYVVMHYTVIKQA
jgi:hypothetical protein